MLSVDMASLWSDETEQVVKGIKEAINNIVSYYYAPKTSKSILSELMTDINLICDFWTVKTYVGKPKVDIIKNAFQSFFEQLMRLLLAMKDSKKKYESKIANAMLFRGTVYRYIGNANPSNKTVEPIFDNVYVSWNKCSENSYILSKLSGPVTLLTCEISEPLYGIDISAIGCSRGTEEEVVFPTIAECIREIKYLAKDEDDENDQT